MLFSCLADINFALVQLHLALRSSDKLVREQHVARARQAYERGLAAVEHLAVDPSLRVDIRLKVVRIEEALTNVVTAPMGGRASDLSL